MTSQHLYQLQTRTKTVNPMHMKKNLISQLCVENVPDETPNSPSFVGEERRKRKKGKEGNDSHKQTL